MISPAIQRLGLATFVGLTCSIRVVTQGNVAVVERLGKFRKCLEPGLHFIIPLVDRLATRVSCREQVFDIPPQKCITLDNAPLEADAVVYWKVLDPQKAFYSVMDLNLAIQNLVLTQLRSEIGKLSLDDTFSAREQINSVLLQDLDVATAPWGVKITRIEVRDIIPNKEIMDALESQMAAERTKRAVVIKSEGERARAINQAEGEAQSKLIQAKATSEAVRIQAAAQAEQLELEAQGAARAVAALTQELGGIDSNGKNNTTSNLVEIAAQFQLARESIEAQRALATSPNSKVVLSLAGGGGGCNANGVNDAWAKAVSLFEAAASN